MPEPGSDYRQGSGQVRLAAGGRPAEDQVAPLANVVTRRQIFKERSIQAGSSFPYEGVESIGVTLPLPQPRITGRLLHAMCAHNFSFYSNFSTVFLLQR